MIMNNSDMPMAPLDHEFKDAMGNEFRKMYTGLTKMEHFAGLAMQGLISAGGNGMPESDKLAVLARRYAEDLLKELEVYK